VAGGWILLPLGARRGICSSLPSNSSWILHVCSCHLYSDHCAAVILCPAGVRLAERLKLQGIWPARTPIRQCCNPRYEILLETDGVWAVCALDRRGAMILPLAVTLAAAR